MLQLHNTGSDKIVTASKAFLDGFYAFIKNWLTQYSQNIEQRGFLLPGDESAYESPVKK
jgi:hypothetical protein